MADERESSRRSLRTFMRRSGTSGRSGIMFGLIPGAIPICVDSFVMNIGPRALTR
jgi:hypothetical protein